MDPRPETSTFATQRPPSAAVRSSTPIDLMNPNDPRPLNESLLIRARLLDALHQAVIATDATGAITYWNPRAEELYGWRAAEVLGQSIVGVTTAPDDDVARSIFNRIRTGAT